ncbi:MAG: helix-turn-helix domain-containing protein [Gammaproteobacteria bacterium]|nr:helix-turn-helix domain-containing protein [Gammaproteobacteria bacterium]
MHDILNKNLRMLLSKHKLTSKKLSDITCVPLPTISRFRSDRDVNPTINSLLPICKYFNVSVDQILGFSPLPSDEHATELAPHLTAVPLIKCDSLPDFGVKKKSKDVLIVYTELSQDLDLYALNVETTCWRMFQKGSIIFVSRNTKPQHGDYVIAYSVKDHAVGIKQYSVDIESVYLKSLNDNADIVKLNNAYKISGVIVQEKHNFYLLNEQ